jgi:uncharacterized protein involved in type VI secretion and phage assembly
VKDIKGVVVGVVRDVDAGRGAVKVDFPWMSPAQESNWAPVASLMSGRRRGVFYMPEVGDEALVAFEHGDFEHPFVVGFLWNGADVPPTTDRRLRVIHSVNDHEIAIYDPEARGGDRGYVRIRDAHGNVVELANGKVTITSVGVLQLQAPVVTINGRLVSPVGGPI